MVATKAALSRAMVDGAKDAAETQGVAQCITTNERGLQFWTNRDWYSMTKTEQANVSAVVLPDGRVLTEG